MRPKDRSPEPKLWQAWLPEGTTLKYRSRLLAAWRRFSSISRSSKAAYTATWMLPRFLPLIAVRLIFLALASVPIAL